MKNKDVTSIVRMIYCIHKNYYDWFSGPTQWDMDAEWALKKKNATRNREKWKRDQKIIISEIFSESEPDQFSQKSDPHGNCKYYT